MALCSGAKALDSPSPVLPHTGADFCHWEVSVARITPTPTSEPEPSAPFRAPHPNHVRRVLESHQTAFWRGQGLNPHKEPGRAHELGAGALKAVWNRPSAASNAERDRSPG